MWIKVNPITSKQCLSVDLNKTPRELERTRGFSKKEGFLTCKGFS